MYGTKKRWEIKLLLRKGHAQRTVARIAGVSVETVKRVARESDKGCQMSDAARSRMRRVGRPSCTRQFRKVAVRILEKRPDASTATILRIMRRLGYTGSQSAMYAMVAKLQQASEIGSASDAPRHSVSTHRDVEALIDAPRTLIQDS